MVGQNTTTDPPKVTVITPVYNGARYLEETIESVLGQSFTDFEYLLIDDASTDESKQVMQAYEAKDPRIVLLSNSTNLGGPATRNRGMAMARGEYIAVLDQDDLAYPHRLAQSTAFLDRHPIIDFMGAWHHFMDVEGNIFRTHCPAPIPAVIDCNQLFMPYITHMTWMFRKKLLDVVKGYDPDHALVDDYEMLSRIRQVTQLGVLQTIVGAYRHHDDTASVRRKDAQFQDSIRVSQRIIKQMVGMDVDLQDIARISQAYFLYPIEGTPTEFILSGAKLGEILHALQKKHRYSPWQERTALAAETVFIRMKYLRSIWQQHRMPVLIGIARLLIEQPLAVGLFLIGFLPRRIARTLSGK